MVDARPTFTHDDDGYLYVLIDGEYVEVVEVDEDDDSAAIHPDDETLIWEYDEQQGDYYCEALASWWGDILGYDDDDDDDDWEWDDEDDNEDDDYEDDDYGDCC